MLAGALRAPLGKNVTDFDAVVVGAGPAGASAAIGLASRGASVLLLDRAHFPRWKVCGACVSPGAATLLEALGLEDLGGLGAVPLAQLVLRARTGVARVRLGGTLAISREALDMALVTRAERAGATFWPGERAALGRLGEGARVVRVVRDGVEVDVSSRVVIDASGLGRGLVEDSRSASTSAPGARIGLGAELDDPEYPIARGELHMAIGKGGYVGLVRVESGALNVAAAVDSGALRAATPHEAASAIVAEVGLPPLPRAARHGWRGTPPLTRSSGDFGAERLFRLGDAAGYVEPFTGEGIGWALGDGRAAAAIATRALDGWHATLLDAWRAYRSERRRSTERLCRTLASALRRPWIVEAAIASVRIAPALAVPFVRRAARAPEPLLT